MLAYLIRRELSQAWQGLNVTVEEGLAQLATPTEASLKKHRIVSKYFGGWANIVLPQTKAREGKLKYIDLFCGPGQYRDGTRSTPLLILA